jgi:hypothetical protein
VGLWVSIESETQYKTVVEDNLVQIKQQRQSFSRGVWGLRPQRVQGRALVGGSPPGSTGSWRHYKHLFERQF